MSFVAYNPLAAGLLTGKHSEGGEVPAGRFKDNANYLDRFYKHDNFEAVELLKATLVPHGLSLTQATFSWMLYNSALVEADAVLLGCSKVLRCFVFRRPAAVLDRTAGTSCPTWDRLTG